MTRWWFLLITMIPLVLQGVPYQDTKEQLSIMRNDLRNLEVGFQQLKQHVSNQDVTLESVQNEVTASTKAQKSQTLDSALNDLLKEIREIKTHANKLADEIETNRKKNLQLETDFSTLQNALNSVMDALGIDSSSGKFYTVKPGDSLGGIAYKNKTTIPALKKANRLKGDKIFVGQKLKLP